MSINEDLCLFKNFDDYCCILATPPMIKGGWEWNQTYTTTPTTESPVLKYYNIELAPYVQVQANFISTLFLQNIWVNVITFDLD